MLYMALLYIGPLIIFAASMFPCSQVTPSQLDYINAHATSTPSGDAAEALAIHAIARNRPDADSKLLVSSTKGATGHLLGAAGAAEAAFTVLAIAHGRVPPTLNLLQPEPADLAFEHVLPRETGPLGRMCLPELRTALCNSFGFGGMNASVLFTKPGMEWAMGRRGELGG
jgi:3-oxoacyl-[acyl-carrier-protein] synthase II